MGQDKIDEVELVEGRPHPAQKSWILKFRGLDDVDQVSVSGYHMRALKDTSF